MSPVAQPLAWQGQQWAYCQQRLQQNTFPPALLLLGPQGIGKQSFARALTQRLLCRATTKQEACGECDDCHWFMQGTHPDSHMLIAKKTSALVTIDAVRQMRQWSAITAQRGWKVACIPHLEQCSPAAYDALLKILEEPLGETAFILSSACISALPTTIRSRCQLVHFGYPDASMARSWLAGRLPDAESEHYWSLAEGAPFRAVMLAEQQYLSAYKTQCQQFLQMLTQAITATELSILWQALSHSAVFSLLQRWLTDVIQWQMAEDAASLTDTTMALSWASLIKQPITACFNTHLELQKTRLAYSKVSAINKNAALEALFLSFQNLCCTNGDCLTKE